MIPITSTRQINGESDEQYQLRKLLELVTSLEAKKEASALFNLIKKINSDQNTKRAGRQKILITSPENPLQLSNFISGINGNPRNNFRLSIFLYMHSLTLKQASLRNSMLSRVELNGVDLTGANLTRADLTMASLLNAKLNQAVLVGARLNYASLNEAVLTDAVLTDAVLTEAEFTGANLTRANLNGAVLIDANLKKARLASANLFSANLFSANLNEAQLRFTNLQGAELSEADLNDIHINRDTRFDQDTRLIGIKCKRIFFEDNPITEQVTIKQKVIELGAQRENISFAQAA